MPVPSFLSLCRRFPSAFALLAIVACGGHASGVTGSGSSSGTSSGVSAGASTGASVGVSSGTITGSGSSSPDAGVDAGVAVPPSCAPGGPGMTNCGPGGSGTESCCTSLGVTGGTYYRTYDLDVSTGVETLSADGGPTGEADPATVSSFRLDKYLVTVGRFRQFVNAWNGGNGYTPQAGSGKHSYLNGGQGLVNVGGDAGVTYETGWVVTDDSNIAPTNTNLTDDACQAIAVTWTPSAGSQESLPINCVNWYESYAFCIWDGGFLPSEAEWEYAAAGGSQQREYPWGTTDPGTGNQYAIYGCNYPSSDSGAGTTVPGSDSGSCTGVANIAPVGTATLGAGLWGQLDLAGEVYEWNLDWDGTYVDPCTDCANLMAAPAPTPPASYRVVRGGSFFFFVDPASYLLPPSRGGVPPAGRGGLIGFRCARRP